VSLFSELDRRSQQEGPIRVAVIGTGFLGTGLVRRIGAIEGMVPVLAANRTLTRAVEALVAAGIDPSAIDVCHAASTAETALTRGRRVATSSLTLAAHLPSVDVIMEATGDTLVGATVALEAIRAGKSIVAANPETQATVGAVLGVQADAAGVVYSDILGDEPGNLNALYQHCTGIGLEPVVAGNFKGVLNRYATPSTQAAYANAHNLKPWIAAAAADGTKLNLEMATVANANGLSPATRGMVGPAITDIDDLISVFERVGLLQGSPIVDYALGPFSGVFVITRSDDPVLQREFHYLKMGDGPWYLFHRPKLLIHYEAPLSAAEAVLHGTATVAPRGAPVAEVVAIAKRDLDAGRQLDGIGGFDCYGLITMTEDSQREGLLPIGLAAFASLEREVPRDEPIRIPDVSFPTDNLLLELRRQQDTLFGRTVQAPVTAAGTECGLARFDGHP
jgi:predicted homoserine dehydrogenase-like protein